jgi:hypothetical protein
MTSIVKLGTQMQNINMRSSKPIIKSESQKQLTKYNFERKFHDLKYFEIEMFFHVPRTHSKLEVINLM